MIHVIAKTPANAWRNSIKELIKLPDSKGSDLWKNTTAVVEVKDPKADLYDDLFPMSREQIGAINNYLVFGTHKKEVIHEWTLLYRWRLVNESYNQIQNITDYLKKKPSGKRAQMSIWDPSQDLEAPIGPCLQIIFCQIIDGKLELHTHMRACDCYGKLLMNINEFAALQRYIAEQLVVECGSYLQFMDSLHFNTEDQDKINSLMEKFI